jgi:hypothetical protein
MINGLSLALKNLNLFVIPKNMVDDLSLSLFVYCGKGHFLTTERACRMLLLFVHNGTDAIKAKLMPTI